jgi:glycine cleavage system H protein
VSGEVVARNDAVVEAPDTINSDPYGDGWLVEIRLADDAEVGGLLDADAYSKLTAG